MASGRRPARAELARALRPRCLAGSTRPAVRVSGADRPRSATAVTATANAAADARGDSQASCDRAPACAHQASAIATRCDSVRAGATVPGSAGFRKVFGRPRRAMRDRPASPRPSCHSVVRRQGPLSLTQRPTPDRSLPAGRRADQRRRHERVPTSPVRARHCARVQRPVDSPGGWRRVAAGRPSGPPVPARGEGGADLAPPRRPRARLLDGSAGASWLRRLALFAGVSASTPSRIRTGDLLRERQAS